MQLCNKQYSTLQSGCQWKDFRRAARNLAAIPNTGGSIPQKKQLRGHKLLAQEKGTSNAPTPALSKKAAPNKGRHIHFFGKGPRFSCHWGAPPRDHPARRAARPPKAQWATNRNAPTPPRRAAIATSPKGRNIDRNSAATSIKGKLNSAAALRPHTRPKVHRGGGGPPGRPFGFLPIEQRTPGTCPAWRRTSRRGCIPTPANKQFP